jgi:hypothetical protein
MADHYVLSLGFLNAAAPDMFQPEQILLLVRTEPANDKIFWLWQLFQSSQAVRPHVGEWPGSILGYQCPSGPVCPSHGEG